MIFVKLFWIFFTPFLKHTYKLSFSKNSFGNWYIDISWWPKKYHENLRMVAGADLLCDKYDDGTGHASVTIITSPEPIMNFSENCIECKKEWADLRYGGQYKVNDSFIKTMWICQVTLIVLGWWPNYIYIK